MNYINVIYSRVLSDGVADLDRVGLALPIVWMALVVFLLAARPKGSVIKEALRKPSGFSWPQLGQTIATEEGYDAHRGIGGSGPLSCGRPP